MSIKAKIVLFVVCAAIAAMAGMMSNVVYVR